jgi:membrane protease YdiL (CAAX protease family)
MPPGPEKDSSDVAASRKRPLLTYFVLVFGLAVPFWVLGALTGIEILPGLPVAAFAALCPAHAAAILMYQTNNAPGVIALLKRAFDAQRVHTYIWYAPTLLLMPVVMTLSSPVLRLMGVPVPAPHITAVSALAMFLIFFMGALGEELGWSGYAVDQMQQRWGALAATLALGVVWAIYHLIGLAQAHRSVEWIAWWSLGTVAARVIIVWLYNNTGMSVFIAALVHTTINVTWQLFPIQGSFYDPRVTGFITAVVAVIVVAVWGPRTSARCRPARSHPRHDTLVA